MTDGLEGTRTLNHDPILLFLCHTTFRMIQYNKLVQNLILIKLKWPTDLHHSETIHPH